MESNISNMRSDLAKVTEYFRLNKLALNLSKTKVLNFGRGNMADREANPLSFNNTTIDTVQETRYLGVILDNRLHWGAHIDALSKKLAGTVGVISKLASFVPTKVLKNLYYALVHSRIEYCAFAWCAAPAVWTNRLQVLQNRALKRTYGLKNRHSTFDLFASYANDVIPVKALGDYQINLLTHAVWNRSIHTALTFQQQDKKYNTRRKGLQLIIPKCTTRTGQTAPSINGPANFNALPEGVRSIGSPLRFKTKLKCCIMERENLEKLFN